MFKGNLPRCPEAFRHNPQGRLPRAIKKWAAQLVTIACLISAIAFLSSLVLGEQHPEKAPAKKPRPVLTKQFETPVITVKSPGAEGNKYGFEGGSVLKLQGTYQLFTSEMVDDPLWVKMKLAHWTSTDRIHWKRVSTLFTSSGEFAGKDPRAALWSPMPVYNQQEGRWNLFYVAYRGAPNTKTQWLNNHDGKIWRAVSTVSGIEGIGGPYKDVGIILQPGPESQPWEGLQGTDSFFPYKVGNQWYGFYGSANTEKLPIQFWRVGLASAPELAGPWKRSAALNPLPIEKVFIENPVVTPLDDGTYAAVYDSNVPNAIGYTWSADGIHWSPGEAIIVQPKGKGAWADDVRTPLGLIPEGNDQFTLFYTGYQTPPGAEGMGFGGVGFVTLKMERAK
jgi:hypothetical protein